MSIQVENKPSNEAVIPSAVVATVTATKASRGAFYIMLTAFIAYQFEITSGVPATTTQALVSFATIAGLLRPLLGYWNDTLPVAQHRRKPYMIVGNILYLASVVLLLTLPNPAAPAGFYVVLAALIIYGIGEAIIDVSTDALMLDVATTKVEKNRIQAMSRTGAIGGIMIAYGLGSFLVGAAWLWFLVAIAAMIVVGTALTFMIQEPKITRAQVQEQIGREQPTIPASYKGTLWIAGILMLLSTLGEGLVNVQLEPWLIARYGGLPEQYYLTELLGAAIALGIVGAIAASRKAMQTNLSKLIIPTIIVAAAFYAGLPWLAPDLPAYLAWVTAKGTAAMLFTLAAERILMDVVKGARKGATYQYFVLFLSGGSLAGGFLGAMLRHVLGMEGLLVLVAVILMAALGMYVVLLAPRIAFSNPDTRTGDV
nr:MFS transporter [Candidatus Sigynarchaeota archaeon]